jgi:hypothetical protein
MDSDSPLAPIVKKSCESTVMLFGSAKDGAACLSYLCYHIHRTLVPSDSETQTFISIEDSNWLLCESHALLADLFGGNVRECRTKQVIQDLDPPHFRAGTLKWNSPRTIQSPAIRGKTHSRCLCSMPILETSVLEVEKPTGKLLIMVSKVSHADNIVGHHKSMTIGRLFFLPKIGSSFCGVATTFVRYVSSVPSIPRTLSVFRVHPNSCRIFGHIKAREIDSVRKMLSTSLVSPNDRDEEGKSLLWVSVLDDFQFNSAHIASVCGFKLRF